MYNPYRTLREDGVDEGFKEDDTHDALHGPTGNKQPLLLAAPLEAADGHHGRSSPRGDGADNIVAIQESHPGEVSTDDAVWALGGDKGQGRGTSGVLAQPAGPDGAGGPPGDAARPCCPDGPRYAALGDAVTVSVAEWIGRRIMMVEVA